MSFPFHMSHQMIRSIILWRRALFMAMMVEGAKLLPGTHLPAAELKRNHGSFRHGKLIKRSRSPHLAADISTNHCLEIVRMVQLLLLSHKSTAVAKQGFGNQKNDFGIKNTQEGLKKYLFGIKNLFHPETVPGTCISVH